VVRILLAMIQRLTARPVARSLVVVFLAFGYGWLTGRIEAPDSAAVFWVGNLAAPYLIIGLFGGLAARKAGAAAAIGALSVVATVAGFYNLPRIATATQVGEGLAPDAPRSQAIAQAVSRWLSLMLWGSTPWLTIGVITGVVMGLLGHWWASRRSLIGWYVAGAALVAEPLAYATRLSERTLGAAHQMTWHNMMIWGTEFLTGLAFLAVALRVHWRRDRLSKPAAIEAHEQALQPAE
jgi:hypothetical protein